MKASSLIARARLIIEEARLSDYRREYTHNKEDLVDMILELVEENH